MFWSAWILTVTYLSTGVWGFYPFMFDEDTVDTADTTTTDDTQSNVRRFFPYLNLGSEDDEGEGDIPTLTIRKGPSVKRGTRVKRDNTYSFVSAATPTATDSMAISEDSNDYSYFSILKFGSSGKEMYMLLDTGSATTWIMGSSCTTSACKSHNTFGSSDSTTFVKTSETFNMTYGSGKVGGLVANDTVKAGSLEVDLSFGWATSASDAFLNFPIDGLLGIGRAEDDTISGTTFMEALDEAGLLKSKLIGVHLQREADNTKDGEISLGVIDSSKYTGDLVYTSVVSKGSYWEIAADDLAFDGTSAGLDSRTAIIDTGTSYVLLPPNDATALFTNFPDAVKSGSQWHVPCNSTAPVQFSFSGTTFNVSSKDYVGSETSDGLCVSKIVSQKVFSSSQWILGDVFLKNVYAVFDYDKQRIGFANSANANATTSSNSSTESTSLTSSKSSNDDSSDSASSTSSAASNSTSSTAQQDSGAAPAALAQYTVPLFLLGLAISLLS
ncbi:MAG: hypothetical protein M1834_009155 [Cirrosporium novae-zelandiae]|nr:MAG: hypothetical protein M1834_009155 [Cirrosporium novae-zelandiae]